MEQVSEFLENFGYMTFSNTQFWIGFGVLAAVILCYQLGKALCTQRDWHRLPPFLTIIR